MESSLIIPIVVCDDIETRLIFVVDVRDSASTSHNYVNKRTKTCLAMRRQCATNRICSSLWSLLRQKGSRANAIGEVGPSSSQRDGRRSLPWQRGTEDEGSTFAYGKLATLAASTQCDHLRIYAERTNTSRRSINLSLPLVGTCTNEERKVDGFFTWVGKAMQRSAPRIESAERETTLETTHHPFR
jgi:hypothetical protein